jgi:hypothetical protein
MSQPLTDRDRTLLAATLEDLASGVREQMAYAIAIHDGRDQGSHNIQATQETEECQRLTGILQARFQAWLDKLKPATPS